ncbi:MAG: phosphatidylserine decarboxylase [Acidobacteria bacterium]|nr:phosphatidylserine decarboxylase [Acidobacteriota bacterium]
MTRLSAHQYVRRECGAVLDETLFGDRIVNFLYSNARESAPVVFRALTGKRMSKLLSLANFDLPLTTSLLGNSRFLEQTGVDLSECVEPPESFTTPRKIFERRIRYWECRPEPGDPHAVVSPADSRLVIGSFQKSSGLFAKGKFFDFEELLGPDKRAWLEAFDGGDFGVFRLTPDKYHYNHTPVAGVVLDAYEISGTYHSCNPGAVVELVTPYSKNKRFVTVIDTDVDGGTGVGLVAMVEIVALMIGEIVQAYSDERYESPRPVEPGLFVRRGRAKSLYRPGSSTDVLLFQPGRVRFADDLERNLRADGAQSRFSRAFGQPLVETEVAVRSLIATRALFPAMETPL